MSIIHDALKKVQQGLISKTGEIPVSPSIATQTASAYLYATAPQIETLPRAGQQTTNQKLPMKNKIKSVFVLSCAMMITAASILYIWQQLKSDIPKFNGFAKKSSAAPKDLKPLAQFTINPPVSAAAPTATLPAAPVALNLHGIMSDGRGNLALINDRVYQEGDEVDGAKIIKINLDSITLNINGTEKIIFVKN